MAFATEIQRGGLSGGTSRAILGAPGTTAALGSTQATAAPIIASVQLVTGADGTKGVILPTGFHGEVCTIFNSSASALNVYPPLGAAITVSGTGLGTVNAALSVAAQKSVQLIRYGLVQWIAIVSA